MSILDRLRGGTVAALAITEADEARSELALTRDQLEITQESLLELAMEDVGWQRLSAQTGQQLSREGMRTMAALCRVMAVANPLIKRGLNLRHYYVWGSGLSVTARSAGPDRDNPQAQDVNAVVQAFLDDEGNQAALTGASGREENERALGTDGNVFLALFTSPLTGRVQVRVLPFDEIDEPVTNPDDASDVWFWPRRWVATVVDPANGRIEQRMQEALYPALGYTPRSKPSTMGTRQVRWDAPVVAVQVNRQRGWTFGVPDAYAAIDWARAYKEFLTDWAKIARALSRFAMRATTPGSKARRQGVAARIRETPSTNAATGEPNDAAATAVISPGMILEAMPKSGATIDSESGKPLAGMVAAGLDVPVTMLLADPGQTGARAVAETLDRPTELMAETRRDLWTAALRRILGHVVDQAVLAPRGPLKGTVVRNDLTGEQAVTLAGDTDRTIDISWPDLDEVNVADAMKALQTADQIDKTPPQVIARLILELLGVDDVDEILEELVDEDGNWVGPEGVNPGQAAVDAFNRGADPGAVVGDAPAAGQVEPAAGD